MGVIWKPRITWNTGLVMLKWGGQSWNIYFPRAFQTTHQNGEQIFNSVKGTNLQYFCVPIAQWRVGTRFFRCPHDVLWLGKTACSENIIFFVVAWHESPWRFHPHRSNMSLFNACFVFWSQCLICLQKETSGLQQQYGNGFSRYKALPFEHILWPALAATTM